MIVLHFNERSGIRWPDILRAAPRLLVFKYSPQCPRSRAAEVDIRAFADTHPQIAVLPVDVIRQHELSTLITQHLAVPHASPQLILLEKGAPIWTASHGRVTTAALEEVLMATTAPGQNRTRVPGQWGPDPSRESVVRSSRWRHGLSR
ncbi:MAG: DUF2847 family protein [Gemmatimonadetes bacterium]|nr:DUF2847 family protein [Gemmatimonadota bacterium]